MHVRRATIGTTVLAMLLSILFLGASGGSSQASAPTGKVFIVQAVPAERITVAVDGRNVESAVEVGGVIGPLSLSPGQHEVTLRASKGQWSVGTQVQVKASRSMDVVLHRPASRQGDPVVSTYDVPMKPIAPNKARVVLAHTATAPPADVRVDGTTVFTNIANGEFAKADVPAGEHVVALLPSGGQPKDAFLGPLTVDLPATTVTMVYAVGSPRNNSMQVVAHEVSLASDGSSPPSDIDTGSSAGLVRDVVVSPFGR